MRKSIIAIAGLFAMAEFGSTPPSVQAAVPIPFATEFTQLLNWGQLLSVNLTAATQLANEIQQLQNSIRNLVRLPNQIFGPIQADINSWLESFRVVSRWPIRWPIWMPNLQTASKGSPDSRRTTTTRTTRPGRRLRSIQLSARYRRPVCRASSCRTNRRS